jgi:hypothetical protein
MKADNYIKSLKSASKRAYAAAYWQWMKDGETGPEPSRGDLTVMGAQAVRMNLAEFKKNPSKKRRKTKKRRTRKRSSISGSPSMKRLMRSFIAPRKVKRKRIVRVKRNPIGRFVICATLENGKHFYFRKSTESFVAGLAAATRYRSAAVAMRTAKLLLKQLPREIVSIKVDPVKR